MPDSRDLAGEIARLRAEIDARRPLAPETVRSLREALDLEWTYHSNAIEGNTLTLKETKVVLEGITIGGKSVREHLEAINHARAIEFLEGVVSGDEPITERLIREIHGLILKGIDDGNAGRWRTGNVLIAGPEHRPPDHLHVAEEMAELLSQWQARESPGDPIGNAAWLHTGIVRVHPFADGNGRTARLMMNMVLMRAGYPPALIRKEDRLEYYSALDRAHTTGDFADITRLVQQAVLRSLEMVRSVL